MKKPLLGRKIAVLVANGFSEKDLTAVQKALLNAGGDMRIVSMDQGLVNSWNDDGWGLNYAADSVLSKALAVDYDMLVVPGGQRSIDKLELTGHTRRFIGGFVDTGKPVAFFEEALALLLSSARAEGLSVTGPENLRVRAESGGAVWSETPYMICEHVMTGLSNEETREGFAQRVGAFLITAASAEQNSENTRQAVAA